MGSTFLEMPDMSKYDINNAYGIALYYAHSDFYAIRGLIETTKVSIKTMQEKYKMDIIMADDFGDLYTSSKAASSQVIYSCRVIPMAYTSILLMMVTSLEEAFNCLCRSYWLKKHYSVDYTDLHGQGIERAITYLEKVVGIKGIKQDSNWNFVKTVRDARNVIVHNDGRIKNEEKSKYQKYDFYIRDEDNKLLFDFDKLIEIYNVILEFIDTIFTKDIS
jgi:hypothetical protein